MNSQVFQIFQLPVGWRIFGAFAFTILGVLIGLYIGVRLYKDKHFEDHLERLEVIINSQEQLLEGNEKKEVTDALAN
jgi:uncharacterized membrane protein